jgi:hypothetical protein
MQSTFYSDIFVAGSLSSRQFTAPSGSITNDSIQGAAGIDASKLEHQHAVRYSQKAGSAVVSETMPVHIAHAGGTIVAVQVVTVVPPTSSDTVTVSVSAGNASTVYASVLSGAVSLSSSSVARTVYSGTITSAAYAAGDSLEVVVTATGSSCQGLCVILTLREDAS